MSSGVNNPCHLFSPFFMNILLLNKDAIVNKNVQEKTGSGLVGRVAAFAANKIVTDESIVANLSQSLMTNIRQAVEEMGIRIDVKIRYSRASLCVIQFQVTDVDLFHVIGSVKGEEFVRHFQDLLAAANHIGLGEKIMEGIMAKIHGTVNDALISKLGESIPAKLLEKGVLVECRMSKEGEEGLVFFDLCDLLQSK